VHLNEVIVAMVLALSEEISIYGFSKQKNEKFETSCAMQPA
jgi:hypothetical protein